MKKTIHVDTNIEIDAECNFRDGPVYLNSIRINGIAIRNDPVGPFWAIMQKIAEETMHKEFTGEGGRRETTHEET